MGRAEEMLPGFTGLVVKDWLRKRGLSETLSTLERETQTLSQSVAGDGDGNIALAGSWYQLTRAIRYTELARVVSCVQGQGKRDDVEERPVLDVCLEFLSLGPGGPAQCPESSPGPGRAAQKKHNNNNNNKFNNNNNTHSMNKKVREDGGADAAAAAAAGNGNIEEATESHKSPRARAELALLDEALASEEAGSGRRELFNAALATTLHPSRFHSVTGQLTKAPAMVAVTVHSGVATTTAASSAKESKDRVTSVPELNKRLNDRLSPQVSKGRTLKPLVAPDASVQATAGGLDDRSGSQMMNDFANLSMGSMGSASTPTYDAAAVRRQPMGRQSAAAGTNTGTGTGTGTGATSFGTLGFGHGLVLGGGGGGGMRQMEHPATYATTMRIMGRDLRVGIENAGAHVRLEKERTRARARMSDADQVKLQERFGGRKRVRCALCERGFSIVNLPMSISYKAIMDLRTSWGVHVKPNANLERVPRCYDEVHVCLFCSQFFETTDLYRPPEPRHKDADALLLDFQKSIEHLAPSHESAFFRKIT